MFALLIMQSSIERIPIADFKNIKVLYNNDKIYYLYGLFWQLRAI